MTLKTVRDRTIDVQRPRRETTTIDIIIIHAMSEYLYHEGSVIFAMDFLNDIQLGCHYFIAPDGLVISGVRPELRTPHVGRSEYLGRTWLNEPSIGIEFLVPGVNTYGEFIGKLDRIGKTDPFTDDQYIAGGELVAKLHKNFPETKDRIVGHDAVSGDDVRGEGRGKKDPGPNFNWSSFREIIEDSNWAMEQTDAN